MPPYYIKCGTRDCGAVKRGVMDSPDDFEAEAIAEGWFHTERGWLCPDCAEPATDDDPDDNPVLVLTVSTGTFHAQYPRDMTATDWAMVARIAEAMAGDADAVREG